MIKKNVNVQQLNLFDNDTSWIGTKAIDNVRISANVQDNGNNERRRMQDSEPSSQNVLDQVPGFADEQGVGGAGGQSREVLQRVGIEKPGDRSAGRSDGAGLDEVGGNARTRSISNFSREPEISSHKSFSKTNAYNDNIKALEVLIDSRGRSCTAEEQVILSHYKGWGGLKEILNNPADISGWIQSDLQYFDSVIRVYKLLNELDNSGAYIEEAKKSTLNAFYTSDGVCTTILASLEQAGFKGGKVLEPSAGIGNFISLMNRDMQDSSSISMVELDGVSGKICEKLFPYANVYCQGFEDTQLDNDFDVVVGNVPFGDYPVFDPSIGQAESIHNFFFLKSVKLTRPGGILALITSRYTMDSKDNSVRQRILNDCDFLGAVRLPNSAFLANAGTPVVTDVIFLQKRTEEVISEAQRELNNNFLRVREVELRNSAGDYIDLQLNDYFIKNRDNMLGIPSMDGGMYGGDTFDLSFSGTEENLLRQLKSRCEFVTHKYVARPVVGEEIENVFFASVSDKQVNQLVVLEQDGKAAVFKVLYQRYVAPSLVAKCRELGVSYFNLSANILAADERTLLLKNGVTKEELDCHIVTPVTDQILSDSYIKRLLAYTEVRNTLEKLLTLESEDASDACDLVRQQLNEVYDGFQIRYGCLNDPANKWIIDNDGSSGCLLLNLEFPIDKGDKKKGFRKAEIFYRRTINAVKVIEHTDSLLDAVLLCLDTCGKIDLSRIAKLVGKSPDEIVKEQQESESPILFFTPDGVYFMDEYLSGNVVDKLRDAKELASADPRYECNVLALEKCQPVRINAVDIACAIESTWIPVEIKNDFIREVLENSEISLTQDKQGKCLLPGGVYSSKSDLYSTNYRKVDWVINKFLENSDPVVELTTEVEGKKQIQVDLIDTEKARTICANLREQWDNFKYKELERRTTLENIYNELFNNLTLRKYDASHCQFSGMSNAFYTLLEHQRETTYRNVVNMGGLMDHMVGSGKTLNMVVTAMELRRLGKANKPMIIGLKAQIESFYETFKQAYPASKILFPAEADFSLKNRPRVLNSIALNDWDCVLITHEWFTMIQQPVEFETVIMQEGISDLYDIVNDSESSKREVNQAMKAIERKKVRLEELMEVKKDKNVLDFSRLGIDFLMVDESHEFKNLEYTTKLKNVRGLGSPKGNKKTLQLLTCIRYLQEKHGGEKGVLFASGTPISNTLAEIYLLFRYLAPKQLEKRQIYNFDQWVANHAVVSSELEFSLGGSFKFINRLREIIGLPELMTLYRHIADVRNDYNLKLDKPEMETHLISVEPTGEQVNVIEKLQRFIETKGNAHADELGLVNGYDDNKKMNPAYGVLAESFARKLSIDPRLCKKVGKSPGAKLAAAAENILSIYQNTSDDRGVQLIFSDVGTPSVKSKNEKDILLSAIEDSSLLADIEFDRVSKLKTIEEVKKAVCEAASVELEFVERIFESQKGQSFNVYQAMKDYLVDKGVPENEIAFIHDHCSSRKEKEAFFDRVRVGDVRIVLGSTKKLGTGVNVQDRVIAVHHIDMTYRPSDVEQRNGRAIRQGNVLAKKYDNKVPIYFYATKRTLDASSYELVKTKLNFIHSIKTGAVERRASDVEIAIDYGSMAAELAADPLYKEKIRLTKEIVTLGRKVDAFNSTQYNLENTIERQKRGIEAFEKKVVAIRKVIPLVIDWPLDGQGNLNVYGCKVGGRPFEKIGEFSTALESAHKQWLAQNNVPDTGKSILAEICGFSICIDRRFHRTNMTISAKNSREIVHSRDWNKCTTGVGIVIRNVISDLPSECERLQKEIEFLKKSLASNIAGKIDVCPDKERHQEAVEALKRVNKQIADNINKAAKKENRKPDASNADSQEVVNKPSVKIETNPVKFKRSRF